MISFAGGFLIANAINRSKIDALTAENGRLSKNNEQLSEGRANPQLSKELIEEKLAEAESNKGNFTFQRDLGMALYRYSTMTRETGLLSDVRDLLKRANKLNPADYDVLVSLGNVDFDIGRIESSEESLENARKSYTEALEKNSQDINVRTDLGWTYFFGKPPEFEKAIREFRKSLEINPKHEKTLQLISEALLQQGSPDEASKYLKTLKEINPQNSELSKLEKQLETKTK
ncbi:MAG: tetratricopeptide repeat protein [Pyrinomonadaceae bacterium]|nr:tetratricopeptide repeat protein [Pyrinomonadaceae bacterium]